MLNTPVLVRSLKLSSVEPSQYLDGWPLGNTGCCWHSFFASSLSTYSTTWELFELVFFPNDRWQRCCVHPQTWSCKLLFTDRKLWIAKQKLEWNVFDAKGLLKTGTIFSRPSENKLNLGCCSKAFGRFWKGVCKSRNFSFYTQILHSNRTNLSPFTKDFRVWGIPIGNISISSWLPGEAFIQL